MSDDVSTAAPAGVVATVGLAACVGCDVACVAARGVAVGWPTKAASPNRGGAPFGVGVGSNTELLVPKFTHCAATQPAPIPVAET